MGEYLAALRGVQELSFDREGIPMVLALSSTVGEVPEATQTEIRDDGEHVAAVVAAARAELFPTRRDGDLGCVISTLQAASAAIFAPEVLP